MAAGYERVDQVEDRGQFAIRGGMLDVYPATEERAVRVDLFDDEVESLRWFSTFTQRSLGEADRVEIAPAAELAPEHRELAEIAALEDADERPDVAELLPVDRFRACFDLVPARATATSPPRRTSSRRWPTTGRTSARRSTMPTPTTSTCARARSATALDARAARAPVRDRPATSRRVPRPGGGHRRAPLREAEAELEKLVRSGYRTVVAWPRAARASAPPTTWPAEGRWLDGAPGTKPSSSSPRPACARASSRPASSSRSSPSTG